MSAKSCFLAKKRHVVDARESARRVLLSGEQKSTTFSKISGGSVVSCMSAMKGRLFLSMISHHIVTTVSLNSFTTMSARIICWTHG